MTKFEFLDLFFKKLNSESLSYFVFGEYENLPVNTGNSDLDVIISPSSIDKTINVLGEIMENNGLKLISYYKNDNAFFYRIYNQNNENWGLQLDLFHKGFSFQSKEYYPTNLVESDIILHKGIKVLEIKKAYFIGFLKEVIHNGKSKDKYISGFINEVKLHSEKYKLEFEKLYGENFSKLIFNNLSKEKLNDVTPILQGIMHSKVYLLPKISILFNKLINLKRVFNKPGFIIAVLGTDGAGKTTIIEKIKEPLSQAVHNSLYYEHMRPNFIPSIAQLLGKQKAEGPVTNPHNEKQSNFVGSLMRLFYYSFDYIFGYWLKIYPSALKKSSIWVFDRYYFDYLIDQKRARIKLPIFIIKLMGLFIPKPDLIICLGAEPGMIHKRKPELPLNEVVIQVEKLKAFSKSNKRAVWIDTGKTIDESVQNSLEIISNKMSSRYI